MKFNIDFVSKFPVAVIFSGVMILASIGIFFGKGLNYGVDFTGGAEIQLSFEKEIGLPAIRDAFTSGDFKSVQAQSYGEDGNSYLIKVNAGEKDLNALTDKIIKLMNTNFAEYGPTVYKTDIVGPKAGEQLRISGFQAMAWALLMIMIYIALRFDYKCSRWVDFWFYS